MFFCDFMLSNESLHMRPIGGISTSGSCSIKNRMGKKKKVVLDFVLNDKEIYGTHVITNISFCM